MMKSLPSTTGTVVEAHAYSDLTSTFGGPLKVIVNPSPSVFLEFFGRAQAKSLRGLYFENGDVIWWAAVDAIHGQVAQELGMKAHQYMDRRLEAFEKYDDPYIDMPIWQAEKVRGFRRMLASDKITWYGGSFGQVSFKDYQEGLKHHPELGAEASLVEARIRKLFVSAMPRKVVPKSVAVPVGMKDFPKADYCSLVAMGFATGVPIKTIWPIAKAHWDRLGGKGLSGTAIFDIVKHFGFRTSVLTEFHKKSMTMGQVMPALSRRRGSFLIFVAGHVLATDGPTMIDTMDTPASTTVISVLQVQKPEKGVGNYVSFDHKQGGKTMRLGGIYWGDKQVYIRAANGEGLLPAKNMKPMADAAPAQLRDAYEAYRKKFQ